MISKKQVIQLTALFLSCIVIVLTSYSIYLSFRIKNRFSGRLWQIPSKVFSDTTILYPKQHIQRKYLYEKLHNLEYREVAHTPTKKGEMYISPDAIEIFLRDYTFQSKKREGFLIQINFVSNQVSSIIRMDDASPIQILELEPEEIMLFFGLDRERRQFVSILNVPQHFIHAIMAAEDTRFYKHYGIDVKGILRAIHVNLRHGKVRQGGSTITQQLAKNYFLTPEKTIPRKLREVLISLILEIIYTKDRIIEIYLNEIYLGQKGSESINGIGEASLFYFDKSARDLSLGESATIAGLIRGPNYYSPYVNKERCRNRRNKVLKSMYKNRWISYGQMIDAIESPIVTSGFTVCERKAPYFMDYLAKQLKTLYSA
ncbi:MAG: transglycosylase domain-containing protein, partial [Thermodesulfobacteriota bacterium]|nr:transglycosylase domain-containing protein [Thermodesulfobacteriota bacterium]